MDIFSRNIKIRSDFKKNKFVGPRATVEKRTQLIIGKTQMVFTYSKNFNNRNSDKT